jgi:hypothetical protein
MAKKIKDLKDGAIFKLSKSTPVSYELNTLDHKKKMATFTSLKSGKTFTRGWGLTVIAMFT